MNGTAGIGQCANKDRVSTLFIFITLEQKFQAERSALVDGRNCFADARQKVGVVYRSVDEGRFLTLFRHRGHGDSDLHSLCSLSEGGCYENTVQGAYWLLVSLNVS